MQQENCCLKQEGIMMFDKLCGLIERHAPQFRRYMEEARIFHFEDSFGSTEMPGEAFDKFFLPFRTIAIDSSYDNSVKVYSDNVKDQLGFSEYRTFIDCWYIPFMDVYTLTKGVIKTSRPRVKGDIDMIIHFDFFILCNQKRILWDYATALDGSDGILIDEARSNVILGICRILYLNTAERFVLEKIPMNIRIHNNAKKITRSDDRPKYTILTPHEIRQKLRMPEHIHQGGTKIPHERRRHPRKLRSDKFVNKQGETIIIPATWVGDREKIIGNKRYVVRTDL